MSARSQALLNQSSGALLAATARAVVNLYRPLLQPLHLTHPQYLVMLALDQQEPQTCGQLATALHLTAGTMSPLLHRLDDLAYVHRDRNHRNERELEVSLTPAGREFLPALWKIGQQVQQTVSTIDLPTRRLQEKLSRVVAAGRLPDVDGVR
jgi:DNA-binding MarR family transcriptional regulator